MKPASDDVLIQDDSPGQSGGDAVRSAPFETDPQTKRLIEQIEADLAGFMHGKQKLAVVIVIDKNNRSHVLARSQDASGYRLGRLESIMVGAFKYGVASARAEGLLDPNHKPVAYFADDADGEQLTCAVCEYSFAKADECPYCGSVVAIHRGAAA